MSYSLDILIVNWNSGEQLKACLASLAGAVLDVKLSRVVVVDNASNDDSARNLPDFGLPLKVIGNTSNLGFAGAVNQGARGSSGDVILLLNPDTLLQPHSLSFPLSFLANPDNSKVAVVGIQLIGDNGIQRGCARIPSPAELIGRSLGLHHLSLWRDYVMSEWPHSETRQVQHVIGAFYMVRRCVFQALGGLDERFFLYLEDLDFSTRIRSAGYTISFLSEAKAYHKGCGSSDQVKARRLCYSLESRILYSFKHYGLGVGMLVLAATFFVESVLRLGHALAVWNGKEAIEVVQGYAMLCCRLSRRAKSLTRHALRQSFSSVR